MKFSLLKIRYDSLVTVAHVRLNNEIEANFCTGCKKFATKNNNTKRPKLAIPPIFARFEFVDIFLFFSRVENESELNELA